ncbi:hypothetical protein E2562_006553 [Oryza meyeriana var. granulata]|uniref:Uncharacterized protein n=1 Tax=Oryza meyeriana var. granulata TaxID=110450 RepID=A0A6G1BTW1_9ORYZ|nr:hypothetical protein E2562_006553 [Oryza meyeriana var. granulata]
MAPRKNYAVSGQGPCRMQWFLRVRRRRAPPPSPTYSSSETNPTASPPVTPPRATNKRKAEESLLLGSDSDGDGRKMRRGETSSSSSAAAVKKTMTLEEIRALPPSATRPFYPRTLLRGTRSIKQPQQWTCLMCGNVNAPTHHLLFDLPAFECIGCGAMPREGDTDFGFCFADLAANEACPIGNVKSQIENECMANALLSCVEITDRVMMILLGHSLSKKGPYIDIVDLISKYDQMWFKEGN